MLLLDILTSDARLTFAFLLLPFAYFLPASATDFQTVSGL
jgi:hypothetical protein